MTIPKELTNDLKKGMSLTDALNKHKVCLKDIFENMGHERNSETCENLSYQKGKWVLSKVINGKREYYGTFRNKEDGIAVREKLKEYNWDKSKLPQIHKELNYSMELRLAEQKPRRNINTINGKYVIQKSINGKSSYFGTYKSLKTAQLVRNELIKCNWDKKQLNKIKNKIEEK